MDGTKAEATPGVSRGGGKWRLKKRGIPDRNHFPGFLKKERIEGESVSEAELEQGPVPNKSSRRAVKRKKTWARCVQAQ